MEHLLIQKAQEGDHDAFLNLLARYDRQIMSVVYRFTGDLYDREDLYQEIFMHCFASIRKFRNEASFLTWLYRIALNRCMTYMKRKPPIAEAQDQAGPAVDWEAREKIRAVHRALKRLKGPQRLSFHLYYIEDWTYERIAALLSCSVGAVKSHLNRARTKIKHDREVLLWQTNP